MIARALLAAALIAAAPSPAHGPLADRMPGPAKRCVVLRANTGPTITDDGAILYRDGRRTWRTRPIGSCPSLRRFSTLILDVQGDQLCRYDRFRVVDPGRAIPSAPCLFDSFTPYTPPR